MNRQEFIKELKRLVASGEFTDTEGIGDPDWSRTKKQTESRSEAWDATKLRKRYLFVKKEE